MRADSEAGTAPRCALGRPASCDLGVGNDGRHKNGKVGAERARETDERSRHNGGEDRHKGDEVAYTKYE